MPLEDKIAAVTGAGQGIGQAIALALAREGATVVVSDLDPSIAHQTRQQIEAMGGRAVDVKVDVTSPSSAQALTEKAVEKFRRLDILVNNAGIYPSAHLLWSDRCR